MNASEELLRKMETVEDHWMIRKLVKRCLEQLQKMSQSIEECAFNLKAMDFKTVKWMMHKDMAIIQKNYQTFQDLHSELKSLEEIDLDQKELESLGFRGFSLSECVPSWKELVSSFESEAILAKKALENKRFQKETYQIDLNERLESFRSLLETNVVDVMLWTQSWNKMVHPSSDPLPPTLDISHSFLNRFGFDKMDRIHKRLSDLFQHLSEICEASSKQTFETSVDRVLAKMMTCFEPICRCLRDAVADGWMEFLHFHRSTSKLAFICLNVILGLIQDGFCTEDDIEDKKPDGQGAFEEEGTGMAEGEGRNDVSDQIEHEEQIQGTRNQQNDENPHLPNSDDARGIEMEQDFEGQLENIKKEVEDMPSDEDAPSEGRMDDQMGNVGPEGEKVDEKLWNDDPSASFESPESSIDEEFDQKGSSEYAEGQMDDDPTESNPRKNSEKQKIQRQPSMELEELEDEEGDEEREGPPQAGFTQPEHSDLELELENEMKLDGKQESDDGSLSEIDMGHESDTEEPPTESFADPEKGTSKEPDSQSAENDPSKGDASPRSQNSKMDVDDDFDSNTSRMDEDADSITASDEMDLVPDAKKEKNATERKDQEGVAEGVMGEATGAGENEGDPNRDAESQQVPSKVEASLESIDAAPQSGASALGVSGFGLEGVPTAKEKQETSQSERNAKTEASANPLRSLGDALEAWKRDLNVQDATATEECEEQDRPQKPAESKEAVFVSNPQNSTDQTLATATEEQMQQISTMQQKEPDSASDSAHEKDEVRETTRNRSAGKTIVPPSRRQGKESLPQDDTSVSEIEIDDSDIEMVSETDEERQTQYLESVVQQNPKEKPSDDPEERSDVEGTLENPMETEMEWNSSETLWSQCQASTAALTSELTEHLRLLLEPTLVSRLRGDYRTGYFVFCSLLENGF